MRAQNFINFTLISLISICGFAVINKMQFGFYGLAWGSLIFGLIFVFLAIQEMISGGKVISTIEYLALSIIAFVFFCKGWIFLFHGLNKLYLMGLLLLGVINLWSLRSLSDEKQKLGNQSFLLRALLRIAVLTFIMAEVLYVLNFEINISLAVVALAVSVAVFMFIIFIQSKHFFDSQKLGNVIGIDSFKSYWLLLGFMLFFSYRIAVNYNLTDKVTFQRLPTEYVELYYRAENGKEERIDGKFEYEVYLEEYEEIMDNYVRPQ